MRKLYVDGDWTASVANTGQVAGRIDEIKPTAEMSAAGCRAVLAATAPQVANASEDAEMEFPVANRER